MCTDYGRRIGCFLGALLIATVATAGSDEQGANQPQMTETPQRIVALNWAATEALLLLGVMPVGVAGRDGYPVWVRDPTLPASVHNVGTRSSPSLEAIAALQPDLIVTSAQLAPAREPLNRIAPTYVFSVYDQQAAPYDRARELLLTLGRMLDRQARTAQVLDTLARSLAENRRRLQKAGLLDKPIALVTFIDARHVRINAPNGLFQHALDGLGLTNAWSGAGNAWGFSTVGLEALARLTEARIVVLSPLPPGLPDTLRHSPFWAHLPAVIQDEIYQIEPVWPYGGVNAVGRLASLLTGALLEGGDDIVH